MLKYISIFTLLSFVLMAQAKVTFKNVKCRSIDVTYSDFEYCYIKAVNRSYSYISLKVKLYKVPINNVSTSFALLKRANGYKPFLYNVTTDACKFLKGSKNPLLKFFNQIFSENSNMNHPCPYDHDIIVEKLSTTRIEYLYNHLLPVPTGDYAIFTTWAAYNVIRAHFDIYFNVV